MITYCKVIRAFGWSSGND